MEDILPIKKDTIKKFNKLEEMSSLEWFINNFEPNDETKKCFFRQCLTDVINDAIKSEQ